MVRVVNTVPDLSVQITEFSCDLQRAPIGNTGIADPSPPFATFNPTTFALFVKRGVPSKATARPDPLVSAGEDGCGSPVENGGRPFTLKIPVAVAYITSQSFVSRISRTPVAAKTVSAEAVGEARSMRLMTLTGDFCTKYRWRSEHSARSPMNPRPVNTGCVLPSWRISGPIEKYVCAVALTGAARQTRNITNTGFIRMVDL